MSRPLDDEPPRLGDNIHPAYDFVRPEIVDAVPTWATRVLDVGCSTGAIAEALRARGHEVTGLEVNDELAASARPRVDHLIVDDVERLAARDEQIGRFDCIVLADVLEHLRDPWRVTRWAAQLLDEPAAMVVSVPNVRHVETLWQVFVRGWWPYRSLGIFDRTHLRFFARRNLPELFAGTDLHIERIGRQQMLSLDPASRWNRLAPLLGDLGTLQFVVVAGR